MESSNDSTVFKSTIVDLNVFILDSKKMQILPRRQSNSIDQSFFIFNIIAESRN